MKSFSSAIVTPEVVEAIVVDAVTEVHSVVEANETTSTQRHQLLVKLLIGGAVLLAIDTAVLFVKFALPLFAA